MAHNSQQNIPEINTFKSAQNDRHFEHTFSYAFFVNDKFCIWIKLPFIIVPKISIENKTPIGSGYGWAQHRR